MSWIGAAHKRLRASWQALAASQVLIRVIDKSGDEWRRIDGDPEKLAGRDFTKSAEDLVSCFRASSPVEEVTAVAARELARGRLSKKLCVLRFSQNDVEASGLSLQCNEGNTGFALVDREHRDLVGDPTAFVELVERILEAQREGEDRVRMLTKPQLLFRVRCLAESGVEASDKARKHLRKVLRKEGQTEGGR